MGPLPFAKVHFACIRNQNLPFPFFFLLFISWQAHIDILTSISHLSGQWALGLGLWATLFNNEVFFALFLVTLIFTRWQWLCFRIKIKFIKTNIRSQVPTIKF
jgi:hypothetical protein